MNTKAKGNRNEHRSMAFYELQGYETMRSAASLSKWDFHAWTKHDSIYCQVKTRDWPGTNESEILKEAIVPPGARKIIHRWRDRQRLPDIKEV